MAIFDLFSKRNAKPGTHLKAESPSKPPAARRLTTEQAVEALGDTLLGMPDPDETLAALHIERQALRRMLSDDEIDGAIEVRREAVLSTPWRITGKDEGQAKWITEEIAPHMTGLVRAAWSAIPFGYSVVEAVYRRTSDGRYGVARYTEKPMEWFEIQRTGALCYTGTGTRRGEVLDTQYKFLVTRNGPTYRNPHGEALLSRLYWPWLFRRSGWEFWVQYLERFGQPLLAGKGADPEALADALAQAARDSVIAVGPNDEINLHQATGGGEAFDRAEAALVRRIQRRILGQTLTTGTDNSGSRSLGEVHERVAETKRQADVRLITETAQQAVNALSWLSFPSQEPPEIEFGNEVGLEEERAERDKTLHAVGVRFSPKYVQRAYGLSEDEVTVAEEQTPPTPPGRHPAPKQQALQKQSHPITAKEYRAQLEEQASRRTYTAGVQALEDMADELIDQADSPIPPDKLRNEIAEAADINDLKDRLAQLVTEDQDEGAFSLQVERAIFAAYVLGYETQENQLDLDDDD